MKYAFEDYLTKTKAAQTKHDLFQIYAETVKSHGLDRVLLCLATDHKDIEEAQGIGVIHNYPKGWMDYYFDKKYDEIDPVMVYGLEKVESYTWQEIPNNMRLNKKQRECLEQGVDAGLHNGICVPLRGPRGALAGLSLASSERVDSFDWNLDLITAYSNHFYLSLRRLGQKDKTQQNNYALNHKEREILKWVAIGKSDAEISIIMNITTHTVNWHMRNVFQKLEVNSRILAVTKAITFGLIQL